MKKVYKIGANVVAMAAIALSATAQQLPNGGFEGEWADCVPWTSINNEKTTGTTPSGWMISNTVGMGGMGATTVGSKVVGNASESAVKLVNTPNPYMASQIVPGYITLGTPFCTSYVEFNLFSGIKPTKNDGGSFGGMEFNNTPDAFAFDYMRDFDGSDDQAATVLVYLWKGSWKQAGVPGEIKMNADPTAVDMVNRDRNILGMETFQGGAVTKSDDAELIAVLNERIKENAAEWTRVVKEIEYKSDAKPEMINVVISAGNYFGAAETVQKDNNITVDNLALIYYSRLNSLSVAGTQVELAEGKYDYDLDIELPANADAFVYEVIGKSAKAVVSLDEAANKATVTVSNDGADLDGEASHVYTLSFAEKAPVVEAVPYNGYITVNMFDDDIVENQEAKIEITKVSDDKCNFVLPNFQIDLGGGAQPIGDIVVNDVTMTTANGVTTYIGHVDGMKLLEGAIVANVDLNGTITDAGKIDMKIDVIWVNGENNVPIYVTFTSEKKAGIADVVVESNEAVEYYNLQGVRVSADNLIPGIYVRRQGAEVKKVIVK